jgi:hypothetical protein
MRTSVYCFFPGNLRFTCAFVVYFTMRWLKRCESSIYQPMRTAWQHAKWPVALTTASWLYVVLYFWQWLKRCESSTLFWFLETENVESAELPQVLRFFFRDGETDFIYLSLEREREVLLRSLRVAAGWRGGAQY